MPMTRPFQPTGPNGTDTPTNQTSVSLSVAVQYLDLPPLPIADPTVRIVVDGGSGAAFCFSASSGLTLDNGIFVPADREILFTIPAGTTQFSVIGRSAAGIFRVHGGTGGD